MMSILMLWLIGLDPNIEIKHRDEELGITAGSCFKHIVDFIFYYSKGDLQVAFSTQGIC